MKNIGTNEMNHCGVSKNQTPKFEQSTRKKIAEVNKLSLKWSAL